MSTPFRSYNVAHRFAGDGWPFNPTPLGGVYMSPPVVAYVKDDYPYVLGVGTDGCLWQTGLDWWSGGQIVVGPYPTGICGIN